MKVTTYVVPAAGDVFFPIPATQPSRRVEIVEDDSSAEQGLIYKLPFDRFVQVYEISAAREPIVLGGIANNKGKGSILGLPAQVVAGTEGPITLRAADILIMLMSASGDATKVRVTEFD